MDKDRIEGSALQAKGRFRRFFGRLFGDRKMQVKGAVENEIGKAQSVAGGAKDKLRGK